jgi:hypothetical protein
MGVSHIIDKLCNIFTIEKKIENYAVSNMWHHIQQDKNYILKIKKYFSEEERKTILFMFYELFSDKEYSSLFDDINSDYLEQITKYYFKT